MQTDDTLFLGDKLFIELKTRKINEKNLFFKNIEQLTQNHEFNFNKCKLSLNETTLNLRVIQKDQSKRLATLNAKFLNVTFKYRQ